jgi:hypothetical protein
VAVATLDGAKNTIPSFISANSPVREARFIRNPDGTPFALRRLDEAADGGAVRCFLSRGASIKNPSA